MKAIILNGQQIELKFDGLSQMSELIELLKTVIDPDHMITSLAIDGRDLADQDWTAGLSRFADSVMEIETGTPEDYVNSRLAASSSIVGTCFFEFREARKKFQAGDMKSGNEKLSEAVNTLQAFFQWYSSIMQLMPEENRQRYDITESANDISEVCKKICQQQLYQSWWALGETLQSELEPKIDKLEDFCRGFTAA